MESGDEFVSMFVHGNEAGAGIGYNSIPKFQREVENGQRCSIETLLSRTPDLEIQEGYFALQWAALPNTTAASNTSSLHSAAAAVPVSSQGSLYRLPAPPLPT